MNDFFIYLKIKREGKKKKDIRLRIDYEVVYNLNGRKFF